jgi:hypothetical protein
MKNTLSTKWSTTDAMSSLFFCTQDLLKKQGGMVDTRNWQDPGHARQAGQTGSQGRFDHSVL